MFRNGLKKNIIDLDLKAKELETKKDLIIKKGTVESIENEYQRSKEFYKNFFAKRQVLTHEKYTLENDVMYSLFHVEGGSNKNSGNSNKKHIVEDKDVLTMLRYYELVNELKNIGGK